MKKFRVYDVHTNETVLIFRAKSLIEASALIGKWYGENVVFVDIEEVKENGI